MGHVRVWPHPRCCMFGSLLLDDPNMSLTMPCELFWSHVPKWELQKNSLERRVRTAGVRKMKSEIISFVQCWFFMFKIVSLILVNCYLSLLFLAFSPMNLMLFSAELMCSIKTWILTPVSTVFLCLSSAVCFPLPCRDWPQWLKVRIPLHIQV